MASTTTTAARQAVEMNRLKAISHPLRSEILMLLGERTLSPVQISREIGGDVREISRQCKILVKLECAELVKTRPRRGATEHFYAATALHLVDDEQWEELHPVQQDHFIGDIVRGIVKDLVRAFQAKLLGRGTDAMLARTPLVFDKDGRQAALQVVTRTRDELEEVAEASAKRIAEDGAEGMAHSSIIGLFEVPAP